MPKRLHNRQILMGRRRDLRNNATKAEVILWQNLKNKGLGYKFRRQHSLGSYILDFYCPKLKLAIELDGSSHHGTDAKIYDQERTEFLENLNIKVVRFRNKEVLGDIEKVRVLIMAQLSHILPKSGKTLDF